MPVMADINHALDGQSKVPEIIAIISVCCVITSVLVLLRVFTRAYIVRAFGADDWVLVVAQILAVAAAVAIGLEQHYGLGRHVWTIPDLTPYTKSFYASVLVYNASLVLVKISIVLMYRRIFVGPWIRRANIAALLFLVAWGIALITSLSMLCLPIQRLWDPTVDGHCIDFVPAFFAPAVINMITDFTIFVMPLPAIRQLQLPLRQKIILTFILCLGLFTCIISIVRLSTLDAAATSSDTTWDNVGAALWSYLELTVALMAACLPTLRPFVSRFFPRIMTTSSAPPSAKAAGPDGPLKTWGGSGGPGKTPSGQYSQVGDSTDVLYADPEIALEALTPTSATSAATAPSSTKTAVTVTTVTPVSPVSPPAPAAIVAADDVDKRRSSPQTYRASVIRRGCNETIIGAGDSVESPAKAAAGIRATTIIKQEYQ